MQSNMCTIGVPKRVERIEKKKYKIIGLEFSKFAGKKNSSQRLEAQGTPSGINTNNNNTT